MEQQKDVRTRMHQVIAKHNIKQVDIARQTGTHHSTLSLWLQGKVKGHNINIEDTLTEWLDNFYSGKNRYTTLNKTQDKQFILTPPAYNLKKRKQSVQNDDILIPVHLDLDLEIEGKKYKEIFCWNLNDPYYTPQQYAKLLVNENHLLALYENKIVDAIKKAINYFRNTKLNQKQPCLKILQLDVKVSNICLRDRFQWDINDDCNCPEDFAYDLCRQLGLNGQFMVKIAHQIREQIQYYRKNSSQAQFYKTEQLQFSGNNPILDIKKSTRNLISLSANSISKIDELPNTNNYIRYLNPSEWQPEIEILDAGEVRKLQKYQERKNRYARRNR